MINWHIYRSLPRGVNELNDIKSLLKKSTLNVIFDARAYVGQLSKRYAECYPERGSISFNRIIMQSNFDSVRN